MNLVLGDTVEEVPGSTTGNIICMSIIIIIKLSLIGNKIGMVVIRGNSIVQFELIR